MDQIKIEDKLKSLETEVSAERARLSSDRMDISFGELINLYKNKELIIRPEYQRFYRWNVKQKTALIESLLLGIPVPPIFVAEDEDGIWELVDGLQRVSTFISFFGELQEDLTQPLYVSDDEIESEQERELLNNWALDSGGLIKNLEGLTVDTIPQKYKINLKRSVCRVEILRGKSNVAMKFELFKRLNSGGSVLTPQEIRNAIYRGKNKIVNELLEELCGNEKFQKLTGLSKQKRRELYDQELVLRFLAFFDNYQKVNDNTENYLNSFMAQAVEDEKFDSNKYRTVFNDVIDLVFGLGEEHIFRNDNNLFVPVLFEAVMVCGGQNIQILQAYPEILRERIKTLKYDKDFKKYSGTASNSKSRIKKRLERANEIIGAEI